MEPDCKGGRLCGHDRFYHAHYAQRIIGKSQLKLRFDIVRSMLAFGVQPFSAIWPPGFCNLGRYLLSHFGS